MKALAAYVMVAATWIALDAVSMPASRFHMILFPFVVGCVPICIWYIFRRKEAPLRLFATNLLTPLISKCILWPIFTVPVLYKGYVGEGVFHEMAIQATAVTIQAVVWIILYFAASKRPPVTAGRGQVGLS